MIERYFRSYVFPEDDDVVFIGLARWIERPENETPLLGNYLCDEAEVNARFDALESDLRRCRKETLATIKKVNRKSAEARAAFQATRRGEHNKEGIPSDEKANEQTKT